MRLKNLTIKGFKSFADETVIHFNESITGIVGPNGSGKSNIVDAIRWVLGEQKGRELRLEQMSDVIFNGTKRRKEAPMAQVVLNFENTKNLLPTDYQNIEIARLLYRSGDSEYRLNGVTCRLKDITGLFLDTGVGSDSYAIIALNMVEDLLSNKESARRKMFEQAAGISKYKARKRESLNKLKATREDLARIEDLLFEINNNLLELEKQAKRTKRFNELKEKYKSFGLYVQYLTAKSLKQKLEEIESSIQGELIRITEEESAIHLTEAQIEGLKKSHLDQEKHLSDFQKKVNEVLDAIRSLESTIQIAEQKQNMQLHQLEMLDQSIGQTSMKLTELTADLDKLQREIETSKSDFESAGQQLKQAEEVFLAKQEEFNHIKSGVDQFQQEKHRMEAGIFDLEKAQAIYENQIENLNSDTLRCKDEIKSRGDELTLVKLQSEELSGRLQSLETEIQGVQEEETKRINASKQIQLEIESYTEKSVAVNRLKDARSNEYELLKSMIDKMEGFPESIKFLHENWRKDIPILSDLIYTDEKYRAAIELYLENYLNFYVVHTEDDAIKAIRLLFNHSKGKANFFILDKFRNNSAEIKKVAGCTPALSLIEVSDKYTPLFDELLRNVYVLEEEQHLEDINRFPDEISVISLTGSVLKANKMLSGGSVGLFEGKKLGRKKNLEKLELEINKLDEESISLSRNLAELKDSLKAYELQDQSGQLQILRSRQTELLQQSAQSQTRMQHLLDIENELNARIQSNSEKIVEFTDRMKAGLLDVESAKNQLLQLSGNLSSSDDEFNRISLELSEVSNQFNQAKIELLKWENRYNNVLKDGQAKEEQRLEAERYISSEQQKVLELKKSLEELKEQQQTEMAILAEKLEFRKTMDSDLSDLERNYYETRNQISELETKARLHQKNLHELQSQVNSIRDQKAEWRFRLQSAVEKARIEFHAELDNYIPEESEEPADLEQLQDKANYYKTRIDNYGEVNPLALEAYEEMKSRMDKIQIQKEDILKAQDSLLETIQEIESTATAGFMQAFNQVRVHFQAVFRSLFTDDDDCDLILEDELDPLECDIDIIAKPKGKRPKSISQLSGGEKTLTAIALLFSLYLLKPAPFCIFDEVDAPLDDINIEKFNSIIRKFSADSQFILITHNKLTMADVDVLYGVYMEEPGISSVTAVDFRKYKHEIELEEMAN
ncbi:MAG: chromosome segregation protein SMC [Saprospiraceae bacterium]|nr:chromosome segregation protein SMC [Saprospiraceae bacterium]